MQNLLDWRAQGVGYAPQRLSALVSCEHDGIPLCVIEIGPIQSRASFRRALSAFRCHWPPYETSADIVRASLQARPLRGGFSRRNLQRTCESQKKKKHTNRLVDKRSLSTYLIHRISRTNQLLYVVRNLRFLPRTHCLSLTTQPDSPGQPILPNIRNSNFRNVQSFRSFTDTK